MKKKLEAELISIAHRILQLKNKSDVAVLHEETRKLYEKLSVLRFVEENFAEVKPTIGQAEIEDKLESAFDYNDKIVVEKLPAAAEKEETASGISEIIGNLATRTDEVAAETEEIPTEPVIESAPEQPETIEEIAAAEPEMAEEITAEEETTEEPVAETTIEEAEPETAEEETPVAETEAETPAETNAEEPVGEDIFKPAFELSFEAKTEEPKEEPKPATPQFSFDDLLGKDYVEPVFVKPEENEKPAYTSYIEKTEEPAPAENENVIPITRFSEDPVQVIPIHKNDTEPRSVSLNDRLSKGITIGLNDRIAFMKNLFGNSSEDYNRVLSQLITFDTLEEAKRFIDDMVKPDYNNWEGKEEYEQRFMEIVEKRFS